MLDIHMIHTAASDTRWLPDEAPDCGILRSCRAATPNVIQSRCPLSGVKRTSALAKSQKWMFEGGCRHEVDTRFDCCCSYVLRDSSSFCGVSEDWRGSIRDILCR